ncbi:hypothetical protein [Secundilactobacillus folii]|uniref:Uncharacterized protein n=1 Tax=Secundilactobacillus folii TaxID=2678357 RepID=A0A7X3C2U7_9LACO|nr:hypothetical protein [Secundilactobacillus folii]MTV81827.1 hypothetical protein [Secundilactobacillus folii]
MAVQKQSDNLRRQKRALLAKIQSVQARLSLTNRAVLAMEHISPEREMTFYKASADLEIYTRILSTLEFISQQLKRSPVDLPAYTQQQRQLTLHNIYLRNRYAFWLSNFVTAGGTADFLRLEAQQNGDAIIKQIVWSGNLLISRKKVRHLLTHAKQLKPISDAEYDMIVNVMKEDSNAPTLFYTNLELIHLQHKLTDVKVHDQSWDKLIVLQAGNSHA